MLSGLYCEADQHQGNAKSTHTLLGHTIGRPFDERLAPADIAVTTAMASPAFSPTAIACSGCRGTWLLTYSAIV
jgi:hypothetical protein